MNDMVLDVLQIAESGGLSDETHRLAFELVMAMAEEKEYENVFANLPYRIVCKLFLVPMKMLQRLAEDDGERELKNEKVFDVYEFGMKSLKKLCVVLGASKAVPVAFEVFRLHLDDDAEYWKERHAGITMLSVIAEEFSDEMVTKSLIFRILLNNILTYKI